jgi:hypothetical protein
MIEMYEKELLRIEIKCMLTDRDLMEQVLQ